MYSAITVICVSLIFNLCFCKDETLVKTNLGLVSGLLLETYYNDVPYSSFKGIPYAEAPLDELRFLPPIPHKGWEGTYEAHKRKESCLQQNARMRNGEAYGISGTEDCLHLSVFTPSTDGTYPVIVFDYNDHFRTSFNDTKTYSPDFLIEEGIIVVMINHRLGIFGYLSAENDLLPGNAGLKDFILGLRWIQDNIKNFGGDPNKVTLMGNRGGAVLADILLYSEQASGLFGGVIMQSGTTQETIHFPHDSQNIYYKLANAVNITYTDSEDILKELQKLDAKTLIYAEDKIIDREAIALYQMNVLPFSPIIEHNHPQAVLTSMPDDSKIVNDVPIMIGFNSREGVDLVSQYIMEPRLIIDRALDFFFNFPIRTDFRFDIESEAYKKAIREIKDFYFEQGDFTVENVNEYAVYVGDMLQMYAVDYAARKMKRDIESPIFYYMFNFKGALNENLEYVSRNARQGVGNYGATIADELCYIFLCSRIIRKYEELMELPSLQKEIKVLRKMVRMWANFARTRNPTPKNDDVLRDFVWKPVTNEQERNYLHISSKFKMEVNPISARIQFWDDFLLKYSEMAVNGVVTLNHEEL